MSAKQRLHRSIHAELDELALRHILTAEQVGRLKQRYPYTPWNSFVLLRAFLILGVVTAAAGIVVLLREYMNWWVFGEVGLALGSGGLLFLGWLLRYRRNYPQTGLVLELAGGFALHGLLVVLALHFSSGSGNWPALVGVSAAMMLVLAYLCTNYLVLWYANILAFFFFGAQTGYVSGWGAYYLGMTYPVRYLALGFATLLLAGAHQHWLRGRYAHFSRVYWHSGLLVVNLAMWFLSLFGYYEALDVRWDDTEAERLGFTLLWALLDVGGIVASGRLAMPTLRSYGLTFTLINGYTAYFQFIAVATGELWLLHLLLMGGSMLWLGLHLDAKRKGAASV